jgi:sporulation protein YlmC with PRC-barrel domain
MKKFIIAACAVASFASLALAQTAGGFKTTTPVAVAVFYKVQPADMRVSTLIGTTVYNQNNENIGKVEDVIINKGKSIQAVMLGVGGFLGVGERSVAVEPESVAVTKLPDGSIKTIVNADKNTLKNAPETKLSSFDKGEDTTGSTQYNN